VAHSDQFGRVGGEDAGARAKLSIVGLPRHDAAAGDHTDSVKDGVLRADVTAPAMYATFCKLSFVVPWTWGEGLNAKKVPLELASGTVFRLDQIDDLSSLSRGPSLGR